MNAVVRLNPLLFHLAVPVFAGTLTAQLAGNTGEMYRSLNLPGFAPPAGVFAIVWTILYLLMGGAAYLVSTSRGITAEEKRSALALYGLMILMNCIWSFLFFRFHLLTFSAIWTVLLIFVTGLCTALFYRIRPMAGLLLVPTLVWLVFACVLNIAIAAMN